MPMIALAASGLALAAAHPSGEPPRQVVVPQPVVTLGDLVDPASIPAALRARAARIEIGRASSDGAFRLVTRAAVLKRVRARLPVLGAWAERHIALAYAVTYRADATAAPDRGCLRALRDIAEDELVRSEAFTPAECEAAVSARVFRYVAAERSVRARQAIAAGSIVPLFAGYGITQAYAGDAMTLVAASGPVTVTRQMRALQSVRGHERVLVQSPEGEVLSVSYAGVAP